MKPRTCERLDGIGPLYSFPILPNPIARSRRFEWLKAVSNNGSTPPCDWRGLQCSISHTTYGVHYRSYTEQYLDSTGIFKEAVIGILAAVAKQERVRLSERTIAGLQRAKAQVRVGGRPSIKDNYRTMRVLERLRKRGHSIRQIATELKISPGTVAKLVRDIPA